MQCWQRVGIYLLSAAAAFAVIAGLVAMLRMDWSHMQGYASDLLCALGMNVTAIHGDEVVMGSTQLGRDRLQRQGTAL